MINRVQVNLLTGTTSYFDENDVQIDSEVALKEIEETHANNLKKLSMENPVDQ